MRALNNKIAEDKADKGSIVCKISEVKTLPEC